MAHKYRPIFSTQFHPEAKGGPLDTAFLFDKFFGHIQDYKSKTGMTWAQDNLLVDILPKERVY